MKNLNTKQSDELMELLDKHSEESGISKRKIVEFAIREYVERHKKAPIHKSTRNPT